MTDTTTGSDVVTFLKAQHEEVKGLFAQIERAQGDELRDTFQCLVRLLAVHETAEEEVVYPVVRKVAGNGDALVSSKLEEESQAKKELAELESLGVENAAFLGKMTAFRRAVERHAEGEERDIFPVLNAHVDREKLTSMRKTLEVAEKVAPTHPHPHGPSSTAGNLIVGPFVAIADWVRDALHKQAS